MLSVTPIPINHKIPCLDQSDIPYQITYATLTSCLWCSWALWSLFVTNLLLWRIAGYHQTNVNTQKYVLYIDSPNSPKHRVWWTHHLLIFFFFLCGVKIHFGAWIQVECAAYASIQNLWPSSVDAQIIIVIVTVTVIVLCVDGPLRHGK